MNSQASIPAGRFIHFKDKSTQNKNNLFILLLFSLYGPSVNIIGEFRYVEIAVIGIFILNFYAIIFRSGDIERRLSLLFLVAAAAHVISDMINNADQNSTAKRVATYVILALLVLALRWLSRSDGRRVCLITAGFCLSYVFILFVGTSASANYSTVPWRLGLGTAATVGVCLAVAWFPSLSRFAGPALFLMASIHLAVGGRGMGALTAMAGLIVSLTFFKRRTFPAAFDPKALFVVSLVGILGITAVYWGAMKATEAQLFPDELQAKMEAQFFSPYGILATARPELIPVTNSIMKHPFFGVGSSNVDPDVLATYIQISTSAYAMRDNYEAVIRGSWEDDWQLGTPSHSHLFGAWADAGVGAALCWLAVISLCIYVLARALFWRNRYAPLFIFISIMTLWDVLFSPGPHRMEMAVRLMILLFATETFRSMDRRSVQVS